MKKRTIILLVVMVLLVSLLTSCGTYDSTDQAAKEMLNFEEIEGENALAYNLDTKVVYYMFTMAQAEGYTYTYFAPYISENGNFCQYINDEIVEITETDADNN